VQDVTLKEAQDTLKTTHLKDRTVGEGEVVTAQIPAAGAAIPGGSTVVLYLGQAKPEEQAAVPNVVGLTFDAARAELEKAGFFMRASGASAYYGNSTTADSQSISAGQSAALGTIVNVQFYNVVEDGYVDSGVR
jgi:stage V sporulation protein D (sporulation-specific penicillin-binding protein)